MLAKDILRIIPHSIRVIRRLSRGTLDGTITLQHLRILFLVREGMGQTQMADSLQISMAAVSKTVNGLVLKKLILRSRGEDKRSVQLTLSSKGHRILDLVSGQAEEVLTYSLRILNKEEQKNLSKGLAALDKVMKHLNEV